MGPGNQGRFRKDTGEMRLTYANELAMKALLSKSISYPDGAVFAKTGIHTASDPQFASSLVPMGVRRYQLMVKNKSKYQSTGGWGYGLFDPNGKTFPEDPKVTQDACFACHTMVENRGDVFSQPFSFTQNMKFRSGTDIFKGAKTVNYEWTEVKSLPNAIKKLVPESFKKIHWVTNAQLRKNVFQGTLDEMKPVLEEETQQSKHPALFLAHDTKRFVMVIPTTREDCMGQGAFETVSTGLDLQPNVERYCTHD